jgi:hypothetical protein
MSIEENKAVVGRWFTEFRGKDFNPAVIDELAAPGQVMRFTGITVLKVEDGLITEEIGLDDGVTAPRQLGFLPQA